MFMSWRHFCTRWRRVVNFTPWPLYLRP